MQILKRIFRIIELIKTMGIGFTLVKIINNIRRNFTEFYYLYVLIWFNRSILRFRILVSAILNRVKIFKPHYYLYDITNAGYAIRSIAFLEVANHEGYIVTADVADDSLSIIPVINNRFHSRTIVPLPERSAPMSVAAVNSENNHSQGLLLATFNFDESGKIRDRTDLGMFPSIEDIYSLANSGIKNYENSTYYKNILVRKGHWGFRCINVHETEDHKYIVTADRSTDIIYISEFEKINDLLSDPLIHEVDISYTEGAAEPIFCAIVPNKTALPVYCISQRYHPDLTIISRDNSGQYVISQRIDVGGLSRSSVAVGNFRNTRENDIALGIWGGDPGDLNSVTRGELAVCSTTDNRTYSSPVIHKAGIHPTDVVAGDFDGDGLDELAVLNYGSGIHYTDRIHPGNIQIFKYVGDEFIIIDQINVPHPRIGISKDIDNDGKDELIVSLFFDKCLVGIKLS